MKHLVLNGDMLHINIQLFQAPCQHYFRPIRWYQMEGQFYVLFIISILKQVLKYLKAYGLIRNSEIRFWGKNSRVYECNTQTQDKTTQDLTIIGDHNDSNNVFPFKQICFT